MLFLWRAPGWGWKQRDIAACIKIVSGIYYMCGIRILLTIDRLPDGPAPRLSEPIAIVSPYDSTKENAPTELTEGVNFPSGFTGPKAGH